MAYDAGRGDEDFPSTAIGTTRSRRDVMLGLESVQCVVLVHAIRVEQVKEILGHLFRGGRKIIALFTESTEGTADLVQDALMPYTLVHGTVPGLSDRQRAKRLPCRRPLAPRCYASGTPGCLKSVRWRETNRSSRNVPERKTI